MNVNGNVPGEDYADGDFTITFDTLKDPGEYTGGTWSFAANGGETLVPKYLVLKAGNEFGLWDITGFSSGTWDTTVFTKSAISHISFYDTGIVPLPAAAWLLLSGMGALGLAARRRRTDA
jgi:hypothetical protein